ncbi:venom carboxylesterase-6-like [Lucilia sericata]|uniref:venom carboxylesterase-6-like n=1 Tax=Lucilia sericata TaxID=13632 RepID=UPI0018A83EC1|nr:venom carboxylesterase-6-like [Lucilia sericata]
MGMDFFVVTLLGYLIGNLGFVFVCADPLKVCLPDAGCYIGRYIVSYNEKEIETFFGIPYAFPPLRFQPPRRYHSNETHQAKIARCACKQRNYLDHQRLITGSEDCLYLNLYRPSLKYFTLIPVLVNFHGGGFFSGASSPLFLGPEYIMDGQDLILITVSYRLGPFGFLATSDGVIPGNIGLKDQVMALQWVYNNIEHFGGDKFRVTLMGQNAGGISAHLHTFSRISRGLFSAIIAISGTANSIYAIDENPDQTARLTAKYCNVSNWDTITTRKLHTALLFMDADTLLYAGDQLKFWNIDSLCNYKPIVEKDRRYSFLVEHPSWYISNGEYWPVPSLFGRVPNEGAIRAVNIMENQHLRDDYNSNFWNLSVKMLEFPSSFNDETKYTRTKLVLDEYNLRDLYLDGNTVNNFMQLLTDRIFYHPMYKTFKYYVDTINLRKYPLYFYIFNFEGELSYAPTYADHPINRDYNVVHQDDQIYLFRTRYLFPDIKKKTLAAKMITIYTRFVSNFVYYRKPAFSKFTRCNSSNFFPASGEICDYFQLVSKNNSARVETNNTWDTTKMKLWDFILKKICYK